MSIYHKEKSEYFNRAMLSIWDEQTVKPDEIVLVQDGKLTQELYEEIGNWKEKLKDILVIIPLEQNVGLGDALISFSSIEGLPTVILESINFKKPIFYTDCSSGPRELMSPNSNPLEKTKNFEKTDVGYLVKQVKKKSSYSFELSKYEFEYVEILKSFIDDVKNSRFSMKYDEDRFSEHIIIDEWKKMIKGNYE